MTDSPLISVIIPCYNSGRYIGATLASVLLQNRTDVEIIIVDDTSTDNTAAVVEDFSRTCRGISFHRVPHSGKPSVNRNLGISQARGKYIAFLDSDDLWLPGKLNRQLAALEANPDAVLCYGMCVTFGHSSIFAPEFEVLPLPVKAFTSYTELTTRGNSIPCSSVMVRTETIKNIGGFDAELPFHEDHDMWIRLSQKGQIIFLPRLLMKYRIHNNQYSGNFKEKKDHLDNFRKQKGYPLPDYTFVRTRSFPVRLIRNVVHIAVAVWYSVTDWLE